MSTIWSTYYLEQAHGKLNYHKWFKAPKIHNLFLTNINKTVTLVTLHTYTQGEYYVSRNKVWRSHNEADSGNG